MKEGGDSVQQTLPYTEAYVGVGDTPDPGKPRAREIQNELQSLSPSYCVSMASHWQLVWFIYLHAKVGFLLFEDQHESLPSGRWFLENAIIPTHARTHTHKHTHTHTIIITK